MSEILGLTVMLRLSNTVAANLERAANGLGVTPEQVLQRLAERVEVERAGRLTLSAEEEDE